MDSELKPETVIRRGKFVITIKGKKESGLKPRDNKPVKDETLVKDETPVKEKVVRKRKVIIKRVHKEVKEETIFENNSPRLGYKSKKEKAESRADVTSPKKKAKSKNNKKSNSDTLQTDRETPKDAEYDLPSRKAKKKGRVMTTPDVCLPSVPIPTDMWLDNEEDVVGIIYMLTCTVTGLSYIGRTASHRARNGRFRRSGLKSRMTEHEYDARYGRQKLLYGDIRKYGIGCFEPKIICSCVKDEVSMWEMVCIREYNTSSPNGYNDVYEDGARRREILSKDVRIIKSPENMNLNKGVSTTVMNHYDKLTKEKFKDYVLPLEKKPEDYIHLFNRRGGPFGYYVLHSTGRITHMKREFGGVRIPIETSYWRALEFAKWLQIDPKDRT